MPLAVGSEAPVYITFPPRINNLTRTSLTRRRRGDKEESKITSFYFFIFFKKNPKFDNFADSVTLETAVHIFVLSMRAVSLKSELSLMREICDI